MQQQGIRLVPAGTKAKGVAGESSRPFFRDRGCGSRSEFVRQIQREFSDDREVR